MHKSLLYGVMCLCAGLPAAAQTRTDYLDIMTVRVRADKMAEFNNLAKKVVDANRRNNGDHWVTTATMYGESNTFSFVSARASFGDIQKSMDVFDKATAEALGGRQALEKLFNDFSSTTDSMRSEVWRRRWDLSPKAPADDSAISKLVGESRFLYRIRVQVQPTRALDYEQQVKNIKAAVERSEQGMPVMVSQLLVGGPAGTYAFSFLEDAMSKMDTLPSLRKILGEQGYEQYLHDTRDIIVHVESTISRFVPELSNAPQAVIAAAPDFWAPKAATAVATKAAPKRKNKPLTDESK